ncbi:MAG: tetratricopeptide repeat protein [Idiomarina sp.]|nr:tetratricopeptide repeat protein [Idiomarina sp.]
MKIGLLILILLLCLSGCAHRQVIPDTQNDFIQAQRAYQVADFAQAEALLQKSLRRHQGDVQQWLLLGHIYLRTHQYAAARRAYEHAVELDNDLAVAWHQLGLTYLRLATNAWIERDVQQGHIEPSAMVRWLLELQTGSHVGVITP